MMLPARSQAPAKGVHALPRGLGFNEGTGIRHAYAPDTVWVTDITYIKTHERWSYLAAVIDLFSRRVVGWSMQSRMTTELALLMEVWRRKPKVTITIHSDQGSQFTSQEWQSFLRQHDLEVSMPLPCSPSRWRRTHYPRSIVVIVCHIPVEKRAGICNEINQAGLYITIGQERTQQICRRPYFSYYL